MADNHHINQPNPDQRVFAVGMSGTDYQYYLIGPHHALPQNTEILTPPEFLRRLIRIRILNPINGFQCFYGEDVHSNTTLIGMWNPTVGTVKPVVIVTPNLGYTRIVVGCGVCPVNGLKIVKISVKATNAAESRTIWESNIDVYTVRTGQWRNVKQDKPFMSCDMECAKVCVNGGRVGYFRACDSLDLDLEKRRNFFISFDFEREVFGEVPLPRSLTFTRNFIQSVKVNGSLGLLEYYDGVCYVWTMREGAKGTFFWHICNFFGDNETFTKMGTIRVEGRELYGDVLGFRNNGAAVLQRRVDVGGGDRCLSFVRPLI